MSWTIGTRPYQGQLLCGHVVHISGKQGVKGLRDSEAYGLDSATAPDPAHALAHALCEVFHLHLEHVQHASFIFPSKTFALAQQMTGPLPISSPPLYRVTQQLIHALGHKPFTPGIKGRFYDQMQRKLDQLTTLDSNEIATLDFRDIVHRLAHRAQCEQARQRLSPGDVIMTNKPWATMISRLY